MNKREMDEIKIAAAEAVATSVVVTIETVMFNPLLTAHLALINRLIRAGVITKEEVLAEMEALASLDNGLKMMADTYRTNIQAGPVIPPKLAMSATSPETVVQMGNATFRISAPTDAEREIAATLLRDKIDGKGCTPKPS